MSKWRYGTSVASLLLLAALLPMAVLAQPEEDEECMFCHDDRSLTAEINGREVSAYVDYDVYAQSVHADEGCISCHWDVDVDDLPHADDLEPVECGICHDEAVEHFERSLHGQAVERGRSLAPTCETCHGKHDILSSSNSNARTFVMNIPSLCGTCHKEGTTVSELRTMAPSQRAVLEDYQESIHGAGLLEQGLIVTAVCTSCHTSHDILPHEHPESSIHRENIPDTCMECHRRIEEVHVQVIAGELWEARPHEIPVCVECHESHTFQQVIYESGFPDEYCMECHQDADLSRMVDGEVESLHVDESIIQESVHRGTQCVRCHTDVSIRKDPVCEDSLPVDCSICHENQVDQFETGIHGMLLAEGNPNVPECITCHGSHATLSSAHQASPTFPRNIPDLCGQCHAAGEIAAEAYEGPMQNVVANYAMSIHGQGLVESGLLVTATCVDCHTAHRELPSENPASSVSPENVAGTCAVCHAGVYEQYSRSVHSPLVTDTDEELPACDDCHQSHTIARTDIGAFRQNVIDQCGRCHEEVTETYFQTFHGKVSKLGSQAVARCFDCHAAHEILPASDPASTLHEANIVGTCQQCHPRANAGFANYLTHADHHDRESHPALFYTFWAMTALLVSVFVFFGAHTLLWFPRELASRRGRKKASTDNSESSDA